MDQNSLKNSVLTGMTGFGCSALGIVSFYPLESLTRQFHVTDRAKHNTVSLVRGMAKRGVAGFYKGFAPALVAQPAYWGFYYPIYKYMKNVANNVYDSDDKFTHTMAIGWSAGAIATVITNPIWVLRHRMQTEVVKSKRNSYSNLIKELYKENGMKTFFRGGLVTMVKNAQMALLIPLFERWKKQSEEGKGIWVDVGFTGSVAIAASAISAKMLSSMPMYPLDVLRTNIRFIEGKKVTLSNVARTVLFKRKGGVMNLFRGAGWYAISSSGTFAVFMMAKDYMDNKLNNKT